MSNRRTIPMSNVLMMDPNDASDMTVKFTRGDSPVLESGSSLSELFGAIQNAFEGNVYKTALYDAGGADGTIFDQDSVQQEEWVIWYYNNTLFCHLNASLDGETILYKFDDNEYQEATDTFVNGDGWLIATFNISDLSYGPHSITFSVEGVGEDTENFNLYKEYIDGLLDGVRMKEYGDDYGRIISIDYKEDDNEIVFEYVKDNREVDYFTVELGGSSVLNPQVVSQGNNNYITINKDSYQGTSLFTGSGNGPNFIDYNCFKITLLDNSNRVSYTGILDKNIMDHPSDTQYTSTVIVTYYGKSYECVIRFSKNPDAMQFIASFQCIDIETAESKEFTTKLIIEEL